MMTVINTKEAMPKMSAVFIPRRMLASAAHDATVNSNDLRQTGLTMLFGGLAQFPLPALEGVEFRQARKFRGVIVVHAPADD